MDQRLDNLARSLAYTRSRRDSLKVLAGAALAGLGVLGSQQRITAQEGGNSACAQWCHDHFSDAAAGHCTADAAHHTGLCYQCGPAAPTGGDVLCGQTCCASGQSCVNGSCTTTCTPPEERCNGVCVNTQTDVTHCGACVTACLAGQTCTAGSCVGATPTGGPCTTGGQCVSGVCFAQTCCAPEPLSTTCAGHCGPATNNCGQAVSCLCADLVISKSCAPATVASGGQVQCTYTITNQGAAPAAVDAGIVLFQDLLVANSCTGLAVFVDVTAMPPDYACSAILQPGQPGCPGACCEVVTCSAHAGDSIVAGETRQFVASIFYGNGGTMPITLSDQATVNPACSTSGMPSSGVLESNCSNNQSQTLVTTVCAPSQVVCSGQCATAGSC